MSTPKRKQRNSLLSQYTFNLGSALDRNRAAKAEKAKLAEAERISKITSQFIANMSHELRTPLNSIVGFSDMLSKIDENKHHSIDPKEYGLLINQSALQLLSIINEILDISRIQSEQHVLNTEKVFLDEILAECISMLKPQFFDKGIEVNYAISESIPELVWDSVKMRQVFTNILSNAHKFTPVGGHVSILAHMLPTEKKVQITFADDGIGMTAEEIGLAMTPFGQVVGDLSRNFQGTGLGLPIAKSLIELHGGALEVSSEKDKGSIFDIIMPFKVPSKT